MILGAKHVVYHSCDHDLQCWLIPSSIKGCDSREVRILWRRCHMETLSVLLVLCDRNQPVTGDEDRSFDIFFVGRPDQTWRSCWTILYAMVLMWRQGNAVHFDIASRTGPL